MITVTTDFDSGNIGAWTLDGPRHLRFEAPTDGAPWAMWFYFRLDDAGPGPFDFTIGNHAQLLENSHWGDVRPVMRAPGGDWIRAADSDVALDLARGEFRFRFVLPDTPVEIAYSYPYPPAVAGDLFAALRASPGVEISTPGTTAAGRPIPYVILRCSGSAPNPPVIWAHSREHAGEVSGAYTFDGFLRAAASSPLRQHYEIHALPMVDLDAVVEGRYGKMAPPVDHHIGWAADSPRPEIRLAMRLMRESAERGRPVKLFLNFHSPSPENDSYLPPLNPTLLTSAQRRSVERLVNAIAANSPAEFGFSVDDQAFARVSAWYGDDVECRADVFILRQFGGLSCLIEAAYHAGPSGTPSSPERLRALGASVARGVEAYLLGGSQGRIGLYDSQATIYRQGHGWPIWRVPRFVRLRFTKRQALAVGDDPSAFCYFGIPRPLPLDDIGSIGVMRRAGGTAHILWCCYDKDQVRLLAMPTVQVIETSESPQPLIAPPDLPEAARYLRPSFLLEGSFRPFEVFLGR